MSWSSQADHFFAKAYDLLQQGHHVNPRRLQDVDPDPHNWIKPSGKDLEGIRCTHCRLGRMFSEPAVTKIDLQTGREIKMDVWRCRRCRGVWMMEVGKARTITEDEVANYKKCRTCKQRLTSCTCVDKKRTDGPDDQTPKSESLLGRMLHSPDIALLSRQDPHFQAALLLVVQHPVKP